MRPLDEEARSRRAGSVLSATFAELSRQELKAVFEKLHKYVGKSVEQLVNRSDTPHVFRLHKKARDGRRLALCLGLTGALHSTCTTCERTS